MKGIVVNASRIIGLITFCFITMTYADFTDGLVAYYPFSGNANDQSGNGHHGVATQVDPTFDRFGAANRAMRFSGINSAIDLGNPAAFNFEGDFSISAWIKATSTQSKVYVVGKYFYQLPNGYGMGADGDGGFYAFVHNTPQPTGGRPEILGGVDLADGYWHHLVAVFERNVALRGYVNGAEIGSSTQITNHVSALTSEYPLLIGAISNGNHFQGDIDDVRLYKRALSAQEVADLYAFESAADPCIPHAATATVTVLNGFVVGATITGGGCGYLEPPVVMIRGSGTGATAVATITDGVVTGITITNAGFGYDEDNRILIASPPFMPSLEIAVSKVMVTLHVVLGRNYVLESSTNLTEWTQAGDAFVAEEEVLAQEFDVALTGRFFRIREVR